MWGIPHLANDKDKTFGIFRDLRQDLRAGIDHSIGDVLDAFRCYFAMISLDQLKAWNIKIGKIAERGNISIGLTVQKWIISQEIGI